MSVISSTLRGVEYLCYGGNNIIISKIIKVKFNLFKFIDLKRAGEWECYSEILFGYLVEVLYKRISYSYYGGTRSYSLGNQFNQVVT